MHLTEKIRVYVEKSIKKIIVWVVGGCGRDCAGTSEQLKLGKQWLRDEGPPRMSLLL